MPRQPHGLWAEQHLARPRRLLEPGGDIDGVAGDERLAARRIAGERKGIVVLAERVSQQLAALER